VSSYADFLAGKQRRVADDGIEVDPTRLHPTLFPFQRRLVTWAARKGRAALWAGTGLGKTAMQLEWARALGQPTLIVAPLAVTRQTVNEAERLGIEVAYVRSGDEPASPIRITNYERVANFDPANFGAVVLDESSILANYSGVTKRQLVQMFAATPYRLACTATPAPNDIEELCNHADFLGIMSPQEMRSTFFIAKKSEFGAYRLKGHAQGSFYRWMASWAAAVTHPTDLGDETPGYDLPPLNIHTHFVGSDFTPDGQLFSVGLNGVGDAAAARRASLEERVQRAAEVVAAEPGEQWLIWRSLLAEGESVAKAIGSDAAQVVGSMDADEKATHLLDFAEGRSRVLVTDAGIAGFGLNLQRCARVAFLGLNYSWQTWYQAIRRCWRFGQTRPVEVHVVLSEPERPVWDAITTKEETHRKMTAGMLAGMVEATREEIFGGTSRQDYNPKRPLEVPAWLTATS
jgi:hypothetical protein